MKRACFGCGTLCEKFEYSIYQWSKEVGEWKCKTCEETVESSSARLALNLTNECPSQSPADTVNEQSEFEQSESEAMVLALRTENTVVREGSLLCSPGLLRGHTHSEIDTFFTYHSLLVSLTVITDPIGAELE
jgi:hypothetical protein